MYKSTAIDLLKYLLLNQTKDRLYNGHNQLEINVPLSLEEAKLLCALLEKELEDSGYKGLVFAKYYDDGSGSIVAGDYWEAGEHPSGHTDRVLLGWDSE